MKTYSAGFLVTSAVGLFVLTGCQDTVQPPGSDSSVSVEAETTKAKPTRVRQSLSECILAIDEITLTRMAADHEMSREAAYTLARELCGYPLHINARSIEGFEEFAVEECQRRELCE